MAGIAAQPSAGASAPVRVEQASVSYGEQRAIDEVSLTVEPGEFVSLLGPSGSGKTTLLRAIAGFVTPDSGRIVVGDRDVTQVAPRYRNFGMVFQRYALFPHMRVAENVAFGLKTRRMPKHERQEHVREALTLVGLDAEAQRYPEQLSGGQQQRVALARAIVIRPSLLLMDEPLGALDLRLRQQLQAEIRGLQQRLSISTVYVTHDQEEAFSMSDRVVVLDAGRVSAQGSPEQLYRAPGSSFAASFIGHNTVIEVDRDTIGPDGQISGLPGQERPFRLPRPLGPETARVHLVIGAEHVRCHDQPVAHAARALVVSRRFTGLTHLLQARIGELVVTAPSPAPPAPQPVAGEHVYISWDPDDAHLIEEDEPAAGQRCP